MVLAYLNFEHSPDSFSLYVQTRWISNLTLANCSTSIKPTAKEVLEEHWATEKVVHNNHILLCLPPSCQPRDNSSTTSRNVLRDSCESFILCVNIHFQVQHILRNRARQTPALDSINYRFQKHVLLEPTVFPIIAYHALVHI
jgi:hypothetical protein